MKERSYEQTFSMRRGALGTCVTFFLSQDLPESSFDTRSTHDAITIPRYIHCTTIVLRELPGTCFRTLNTAYLATTTVHTYVLLLLILCNNTNITMYY